MHKARSSWNTNVIGESFSDLRISFFFLSEFLFYLFFLFVVNFVIHWNEKALGSHVFPIPIPPPTSLPTRSLQVLPEHQVRVLVSCIQPGPVICFIHDSIHVSMLFSWNIPPSPSPTESRLCTWKLNKWELHLKLRNQKLKRTLRIEA